MDDSSSINLSLIAGLVVIELLLTLAYAALQNARQSNLNEQADHGSQIAQRALQLTDSRTQLYITYTLCIRLLNFALALVAAVEFVVPAFIGTADSLSIPLAIGVVMLLSIGVMIVANVVPEAVGSAYAMPLLRIAVPIMRGVVLLLRPFAWLLLLVSRMLARLFGSDQLINTVTEEEIMTLVNAGFTGGTIENDEKAMIYSVLTLDQTLARELMVPRIDIIALEVTTALEQAMEIFVNTGYSRVPVYEENIDNIVGLVYAKDILNLIQTDSIENKSVRDLIRTAYYVPESKPADELLREMQGRKVHMAIVVDEYGGTSGLITIENLIEEIIGDIRDEYDQHEEYEYIRNSDDEYIIDASMDLDDINTLLNTSLDPTETDTLGGFIYQEIGRVPIVGETIETDELSMRVRSLEGRRIRKVLVKLKPRPRDSSDSTETSTNREDENPNDNDQSSTELADVS